MIVFCLYKWFRIAQANVGRAARSTITIGAMFLVRIRGLHAKGSETLAPLLPQLCSSVTLDWLINWWAYESPLVSMKYATSFAACVVWGTATTPWPAIHCTAVHSNTYEPNRLLLAYTSFYFQQLKGGATSGNPNPKPLDLVTTFVFCFCFCDLSLSRFFVPTKCALVRIACASSPRHLLLMSTWLGEVQRHAARRQTKSEVWMGVPPPPLP